MAMATAMLAPNVFIGAVGLFVAVSAAKLAKGRIPVQITAVSWGVAAISLLANAVLVLLECRTGPMPMAFSRNRPLVWIALAAIAVSLVAVVVANTQ